MSLQQMDTTSIVGFLNVMTASPTQKVLLNFEIKFFIKMYFKLCTLLLKTR